MPGGLPGAGGPFGGGPGGFFNVLPGKTVKKRFDAVCLDHGMPDPNKTMRYELAKLTELNTQQDLGALLVSLASKRVSQETAQLAAWNLANKRTWSELAATPYISATGRRGLRYSTRDIQAAKNLVKQLVQSRPKSSQPPVRSLSASYSND